MVYCITIPDYHLQLKSKSQSVLFAAGPVASPSQHGGRVDATPRWAAVASYLRYVVHIYVGQHVSHSHVQPFFLRKVSCKGLELHYVGEGRRSSTIKMMSHSEVYLTGGGVITDQRVLFCRLCGCFKDINENQNKIIFIRPFYTYWVSNNVVNFKLNVVTVWLFRLNR